MRKKKLSFSSEISLPGQLPCSNVYQIVRMKTAVAHFETSFYINSDQRFIQ